MREGGREGISCVSRGGTWGRRRARHAGGPATHLRVDEEGAAPLAVLSRADDATVGAWVGGEEGWGKAGGQGGAPKEGTPQRGAFRRSTRGEARAGRGRGAARAGVGSAVRRGREDARRTRRRRPDVGSRAVGHDVRARVRECARAAPSACPGAEAAGGRAAMSRWPVMIGSREKFAGVTTRQPWSIVSPEARPRRASLSPHAHARPPPHPPRVRAQGSVEASEDRRRTHASHARVTRAGVERRKRSKETRGEMTDSQATEDVMQAQLCVAGCGFFGCVPRRRAPRARDLARRRPRGAPAALAPDPRARAALSPPRATLPPFPRTRSDRPPPSPLARCQIRRFPPPRSLPPALRRAQERGHREHVFRVLQVAHQ